MAQTKLNPTQIQTEAGLTPGTYTNANVTVNAQGIVTAIANGTGGSGGFSLNESIGSGSDVTLAQTYATIPNISVAVAANTGVDVDGVVELTADGTTGTDDLYVQLYDTVAAAAIANSERHISYLPAGKRGLVLVEKYVPGIAAGRTLVLQVKNTTAARGTVSPSKSLLQTLSVSTGVTSGTGNQIVKPPAGTALKTSGPSILSGLVLAVPFNEASGTTVKDWVSGTSVTIGTGWGWSTDSVSQVVLLNNSSTVTAATFSGITQNLNDSTVIVLFNTGTTSYGTSAVFGQGDSSGSNWNFNIDNQGSSNWLSAAGTSGTTSYTGRNNVNQTIAAVRIGGTAVGSYALDSGSTVTLNTSTMSTGVLRSGTPGIWSLGGAIIGGQRYLTGSIKGVFIWNRGLTAAELTSMAADPWQMFVGY